MTLLSTTSELLDNYVPIDAQEVKHLGRMQELAQRGLSAFSRENYSPGHFTASAFVVSPDAKQVLLILHSKLRLWLQPGGHIDTADASLEAAAHRELVEETGLADVTLTQSTPLDLDIHVIPGRGDLPAHEHFDVRFLFTARSTNYAASSDALDAKWIPIADLIGTHTDESVRRAVRKIARHQS